MWDIRSKKEWHGHSDTLPKHVEAEYIRLSSMYSASTHLLRILKAGAIPQERILVSWFSYAAFPIADTPAKMGLNRSLAFH
jgi:hypothetical protein